MSDFHQAPMKQHTKKKIPKQKCPKWKFDWDDPWFGASCIQIGPNFELLDPDFLRIQEGLEVRFLNSAFKFYVNPCQISSSSFSLASDVKFVSGGDSLSFFPQ